MFFLYKPKRTIQLNVKLIEENIKNNQHKINQNNNEQQQQQNKTKQNNQRNILIDWSILRWILKYYPCFKIFTQCNMYTVYINIHYTHIMFINNKHIMCITHMYIHVNIHHRNEVSHQQDMILNPK